MDNAPTPTPTPTPNDTPSQSNMQSFAQAPTGQQPIQQPAGQAQQFATPSATSSPGAGTRWSALGLGIISIVGFVIAFIMGYVVVLFGVLGLAAISISIRLTPRPITTIVIGSIGAALSFGSYLIEKLLEILS